MKSKLRNYEEGDNKVRWIDLERIPSCGATAALGGTIGVGQTVNQTTWTANKIDDAMVGAIVGGSIFLLYALHSSPFFLVENGPKT